MINLSSQRAHYINFTSTDVDIFRVSTNKKRPTPLRNKELYVSHNGETPEGFMGYVRFSQHHKMSGQRTSNHREIFLPTEFDYLDDGDIIRVDPLRGSARVLYRKNSQHNSFLLTERCNHYCLMCSQPPKNVDDSWIVDEIKTLIPLISPETREIGLTGGEPTLLGNDFLQILKLMQAYLPRTGVHVLTNGRKFSETKFCEKIGEVGHQGLMFGIPLYADVSTLHNYIVQAEGAFDETVRGILNLHKYKQKIEIRIVLHKQTIPRLRSLVEYICRNLVFVDHVALMGLEVTGFTKANLPQLWIDPHDYNRELKEAALFLESAGINTSIYNLQHCIIDKNIWHLARASISDWKTGYLDECKHCSRLHQCGGLFETGMSKISEHIKPILS